jgi:hypothetical protein
MKICPNCQQQYPDENLNFCLNDGGALTNIDEAAPTVLLNQARTTNETNWANQDPFAPWQNQPLQQQQNNPFQAPPQNMAFAQPSYARGNDQTLPTISLVLGILSLLLICCFGGFYFGIAAVIVGFIGMNNANNNPSVYGGKGLAIAGMILGGVSFALAVIWAIISAAS